MPEIYLIRHAECEANVNNTVQKIVGGRKNESPLTERGAQQAERLKDRFYDEGVLFDFVFASTAERAKQTAQIVCDRNIYPAQWINYRDDLLELSRGCAEGRPIAEVYAPSVLEQIRNDQYRFKTPGGESIEDVEKRMMGFLEREVLDLDGTVAIFTHGHAIRSVLRRLLNFDPDHFYRLVLGNTSISHVSYRNNEWFVQGINDCAHLGKKMTKTRTLVECAMA
ncbi:histidine phosphatase family protein [Candidatus Woesearchaeota archaeon]|nr:histidine phosphatase family protein [Candidatus Woesearchaeota archaeon]